MKGAVLYPVLLARAERMAMLLILENELWGSIFMIHSIKIIYENIVEKKAPIILYLLENQSHNRLAAPVSPHSFYQVGPKMSSIKLPTTKRSMLMN